MRGTPTTRSISSASIAPIQGSGSSIGPPRTGGTYNVPQWVQESKFSDRVPRDIIRPRLYGWSDTSSSVRSAMETPASRDMTGLRAPSTLSTEFPVDESLIRRAMGSATRQGGRLPMRNEARLPRLNESFASSRSDGFFRARGGNKSITFAEPSTATGDLAFQGPLPKYQRLANEPTRSITSLGNQPADESASSMFSRTPRAGPYVPGPHDISYQRLGSNRSINLFDTTPRGGPYGPAQGGFNTNTTWRSS